MRWELVMYCGIINSHSLVNHQVLYNYVALKKQAVYQNKIFKK